MKSSQNHSSGVTLFKHVKYEHLVAGVTGGVTSTVLLHPLDLLKIRFAGKDSLLSLCLIVENVLSGTSSEALNDHRMYTCENHRVQYLILILIINVLLFLNILIFSCMCKLLY